MANLPYYEQKDIENIQKLRTMLKELPPFCTEYFRGIEPRTSTRTRIAYAYDLSVFFDFLKKNKQFIIIIAPISMLLLGYHLYIYNNWIN